MASHSSLAGDDRPGGEDTNAREERQPLHRLWRRCACALHRESGKIAGMTLARAPKIACIGLSSWDRLIAVPEYPPVGEQADVLEEVSAPGGTTTNTAVALARLGARVAIATAIGDDERGASLRRSLEEAGVDTGWLTVKAGLKTDLATVIVSQQPLERTIFWEQGAQLVRGDRLDIAGLFGGDVLVVDVADVSLRRVFVGFFPPTGPPAAALGGP